MEERQLSRHGQGSYRRGFGAGRRLGQSEVEDRHRREIGELYSEIARLRDQIASMESSSPVRNAVESTEDRQEELNSELRLVFGDLDDAPTTSLRTGVLPNGNMAMLIGIPATGVPAGEPELRDVAAQDAAMGISRSEPMLCILGEDCAVCSATDISQSESELRTASSEQTNPEPSLGHMDMAMCYIRALGDRVGSTISIVRNRMRYPCSVIRSVAAGIPSIEDVRTALTRGEQDPVPRDIDERAHKLYADVLCRMGETRRTVETRTIFERMAGSLIREQDIGMEERLAVVSRARELWTTNTSLTRVGKGLYVPSIWDILAFGSVLRRKKRVDTINHRVMGRALQGKRAFRAITGASLAAAVAAYRVWRGKNPLREIAVVVLCYAYSYMEDEELVQFMPEK